MSYAGSNECNINHLPAAIVILCIGTLIGFILFSSIHSLVMPKVHINEDTANQVCQKLSNNSYAVADLKSMGAESLGKLVCTIPSYDSTINIIIKEAGK